MKLIVGLGNPGKEYDKTRHNIGFMVLDNYALKNNLIFNKNKFNGYYCEINKSNEKIILLKPQKYMNLSGEVVREFVKFYKINLEDLLIISDDLDMPIAKIKLREKGCCGGHNGLRNIENNLNTQNYKRLKIGVSNNKLIDTKDYVLGKFNKDEFELIKNSIDIATNIIEDFLTLNFNNLMNKYNKK